MANALFPIFLTVRPLMLSGIITSVSEPEYPDITIEPSSEFIEYSNPSIVIPLISESNSAAFASIAPPAKIPC